MARPSHHQADLAALMTAIALSSSEGAIKAALVDEEFCPDIEAAGALIERVREAAEADQP